MSNIVILMGSPRKKGNTAALANAFAKGARSRGHIVDTIDISSVNITPCKGCNACYISGGKCPQKDDMESVYARLAIANVIAVATPVYFYGISGQLKCLIDRLHNPCRRAFRVDRLALLCVCADRIPTVFDSIEAMYESILSYFSLDDAGRVLVPGVSNLGDISGRPELDAAEKLGAGINLMPGRHRAEAILREAEELFPGKWADHSRVAAKCARRIAEAAGLDGERAYILGLLHDVGRRAPSATMRHILEGYNYLSNLGYEEAARVCLTHSYVLKAQDTIIGDMEMTSDELDFVRSYIEACEYDDYDRLIQLCDAIAMAEGSVEIELRMADVKRRYGGYPQAKWDKNIAIMREFEAQTGKTIDELTGGIKP